MILDIELNGEPYCRAGVPEGAVSGFVSYVNVPDEAGIKRQGSAMLSVTGFIRERTSAGVAPTAVHWGDIGQHLVAGDVVTILVDGGGKADPPLVTATATDDEREGNGGNTDWEREIVDLHAFFVRWFKGTEQSMDRLGSVLASGFSLVGPDGVEHMRGDLLDSIGAAHGARPNLEIETDEHRLLFDDGRTVVASYVEIQATPVSSTKRLVTAVMQRDDARAGRLEWLRVHETWLFEA